MTPLVGRAVLNLDAADLGVRGIVETEN